MAFNYRVKYEESVETLEVVCELYDVDNSDLTMKYGAAGLGIMVLVFMFIRAAALRPDFCFFS